MGLPAAKRKVIEKELRYRSTNTWLVNQSEVVELGHELHEIEARHNGHFTQVDVVDDAKRFASQFPKWHAKLFCSTDEELAYRARLDIAKQIICHIVEIEVDRNTGTEIQSRVFIIVDDKGDPVDGEAAKTGQPQRYSAAQNVDVAKRHDVRVEQAFGEMRSFLRRFANLEEVAPVVKAMRKVLKAAGEDDSEKAA
jgi:hypothetical protein